MAVDAEGVGPELLERSFDPILDGECESCWTNVNDANPFQILLLKLLRDAEGIYIGPEHLNAQCTLNLRAAG